ncbi:hypothetical protein [Neolewinella sp.]|uniref:hypothetical protein n=1 Tax=Neolewinella sp. TaxID=2993543 RepID=UPI003B528733
MASSKTTTDHDTIKKWVEEHNGVASTISDGDSDILRIHFPEASSDKDDQFDEVSWEEFFTIFDEQKLAFLYSTDDDSTFNKFVSRD